MVERQYLSARFRVWGPGECKADRPSLIWTSLGDDEMRDRLHENAVRRIKSNFDVCCGRKGRCVQHGIKEQFTGDCDEGVSATVTPRLMPAGIRGGDTPPLHHLTVH